MKKIIVYDFDGTLIKGDSIKLYCKWLSSNLFEFILNYHIRFRLIKIFKPNIDIKHERVKFYFSRHLKNSLDIDEFNNILKENLFEDSMEILKKDRLNYDVYLVSASFFEIIDSFCTTFLKVNLITNNIKNYNTSNDINFKNKVLALNTKVKTDYHIVRGYGNSLGDFDFLRISETAYLRLPNGKKVIWQK